MLLSRSLSFRGAEFNLHEVPLTPEYSSTYDAVVQLWIDIHKALCRMKEILPSKALLLPDEAKKISRCLGVYWGAHQRFFNQAGHRTPTIPSHPFPSDPIRSDPLMFVYPRTTNDPPDVPGRQGARRDRGR